MNDSKFFEAALEGLRAECKKESDFTDSLDRDRDAREKRMPEYKCSKYRYSSVFLSKVTLEGIGRQRKNHEFAESRHLPPYYCAILEKRADLAEGYDSSSDEKKSDAGLYFGMKAFVAEKRDEAQSKLEFSTDWEKIELSERLSGWKNADECLDSAWERSI